MRRGQFGATSLFGHHPKHSLFELKEMNLSFSQMYHWSLGFSESTFFHFVENVITRSFLVGDYKTEIGSTESKFTQIENRKSWCDLWLCKNYLRLADVKDFKLIMGQNLEREETSDDTFEENEITHPETSCRFRHLDLFSLLKLNTQILEMRKSIRSVCFSDNDEIFPHKCHWIELMQI